jgi:hypothetical protein
VALIQLCTCTSHWSRECWCLGGIPTCVGWEVSICHLPSQASKTSKASNQGTIRAVPTSTARFKMGRASENLRNSFTQQALSFEARPTAGCRQITAFLQELLTLLHSRAAAPTARRPVFGPGGWRLGHWNTCPPHGHLLPGHVLTSTLPKTVRTGTLASSYAEAVQRKYMGQASHGSKVRQLGASNVWNMVRHQSSLQKLFCKRL